MAPGKGPLSPAETAKVVNKAALANWDKTPGRHGLLVDLPARGDILVSGDLHGNLGNLQRLIQLAALHKYPHRHMVVHELVHEMHDLGQSCRSCRLVELAARAKVTFPDRFHYLLGNHEFAELGSMEIGKNGRFLNEAFREGMNDAYGEHAEAVRAAFLQFWRTCPAAIRTANRLFISHSTSRLSQLGDLSLDTLRAVPTPAAFQSESELYHLLWGRDYRMESADAFAGRVDADILIVGHTPCDDGVSAPNHRHVILDTTRYEGCYALLPLEQPLTQEDVLQRVKTLY